MRRESKQGASVVAVSREWWVAQLESNDGRCTRLAVGLTDRSMIAGTPHRFCSMRRQHRPRAQPSVR
uniref:Transposase n=1 Tax=Ascaris lumbricoides TaxID=6252 RepID=A0A0M3HPU7_ASCLU